MTFEEWYEKVCPWDHLPEGECEIARLAYEAGQKDKEELDDSIIEIVRSVMDNGTGKAETVYEHVLIKLLQIRGTPMTCFEFDQKRVDECYELWKADAR